MLNRALIRRRQGAGATVALCVLACTFLFSSAPAAATITHPLIKSFGSFSYPSGVGVDEAANNVFVADGKPDNVLDVFGSLGEEPSGVASPFKIAGFLFEEEPSGVAVDNSTTSPSRGDLYVADVLHNAVRKFKLNLLTQEYELLEELTAAPVLHEPLGLAVDSHGNVFVADYGSGSVVEFTSAGVEVNRLNVSAAVGHPSSVALDSHGDLFVQSYSNHKVFKYAANASGEIEPGTEPTEIAEGATGIAVDPASESLYVALGSRIAQYSAATGTLEGTFGTSTLGQTQRVAADSQTGDVYVTDSHNKDVAVFGPAEALPASIAGEWVANVTSTTADLHAQINPNGADTHYRFEYLSQKAFEEGGESFANATHVPVPDADLGSAESDQLAPPTHLSGLAPETVYRYRVVANNGINGPQTSKELTFTTFSGPAVEPAACPNEPLRAENHSQALPDCRAYEMVTPLEKNGTDLTGGFGHPTVQAATSGGALTYSTFAEFSNSQNGNGGQYLSSRSSEGWSTRNIALPIAVTEGFSNLNGYYDFSPDLSAAVLMQTSPTLSDAAPAGYHDLYLSSGAGYTPLITSPPPNRPPNAGQEVHFIVGFGSATPDFSHIVFPANDTLTEPTLPDPGHDHFYLYDWSSGRLQLVNVLPDGSIAPDAGLGDGVSPSGDPLAVSDVRHAVSDSGSRIYFTSPTTGGDLYLRVNDERTVQVDAAQTGGSNGGGGRFWGASSDGGKAFFTDNGALTADAAGGTAQLYRYDAETGGLTDLTVDNTGNAGVQGVLGTSEDGTYAYFVANGVLAPGASSGNCSGASGTCSLYVWHDDGTPHGKITFIATLAGDDGNEWGTSAAPLEPAAVTPDGLHLAFMSNARLTGFDNSDASTGTPDAEVYLYDVESHHLTCASCNPSGARPVGGPVPLGINGSLYGSAGNLISAQLPEWSTQNYQPHYLSTDGSRLFFESYDALVPQDTNGKLDVYEWEASGAGSCRRTAGCVYLISSGTSTDDSYLLDAAPDGNSVFIATRSQLVPQDTDQLDDIYDVRVNGGFPAPTPPACTGSGCQGVPAAPPSFTTPSSVTFSGTGNFPAPVPKPGAKPVSRARKLASALKACRTRKHNRRTRARCEAQARHRYGPAPKPKKATRGSR